MAGKVYLVGAGPGDPGLITVKGMRCLDRAEVVVCDRLVDPYLLRVVPGSAELVFVGKERGRQAMSQEKINCLLVDRAAQGKRVVRLKGGDPFVFGRGGQEALALAEHGIPFEVVPGVTSAIGAAAYAGIPVTHRQIASSFTVVSGSEDPGKIESSVHWDALARTGGTLVVLMGWTALESILATLQKEGMAPTTPVALIQWGAWPRQRVVTATLADAAKLGRDSGLESPVIAVIGAVVNLREHLAWLDQRPLFGKRALVTRSRTQASQLRTLLEELGAEVVEAPSIEIVPLEDYSKVDQTVAQLRQFSWVIFASANAVEAVFARIDRQGRDARAFASCKIGAIGPATAEALGRRGLSADFVPSRSGSESALVEMSTMDWHGVPVLLPAADIGRDALGQGLARLGACVEWLPVYRTVTPKASQETVRAALQQGADIVTFTSSSTVQNLIGLLEGDRAVLASSVLACIGPSTATTATELGLTVDVVAEEHTVEGLVAALVRHFGEEILSASSLPVGAIGEFHLKKEPHG